MLPLRSRVDVGAMAIEGYSAFPKDCLVSYLGYSLGESYLAAGMQSVYTTAPTEWDGTQNKQVDKASRYS